MKKFIKGTIELDENVTDLVRVYNVTHWMPLPELPKESEVSENG